MSNKTIVNNVPLLPAVSEGQEVQWGILEGKKVDGVIASPLAQAVKDLQQRMESRGVKQKSYRGFSDKMKNEYGDLLFSLAIELSKLGQSRDLIFKNPNDFHAFRRAFYEWKKQFEPEFDQIAFSNQEWGKRARVINNGGGAGRARCLPDVYKPQDAKL